MSPTAWAPGPAWLFCPADRPERFDKALQCADVVILDLEDAVAPARKEFARQCIRDIPEPEWDRILIRVNAFQSAEYARDRALLDGLPCPRVMLAKAEDPRAAVELGRHEVLMLVESPAGVECVSEILEPSNVIGAMWGADDLVAGLGGTTSRTADGAYRDVARYARSKVLIAAKSRSLLAVDAVFMDLKDREGLEGECEDASRVGFDAKAAIHPAQVAAIRTAYAPSASQVDWAERVLGEARRQGGGVFTFEGKMVDGPILLQAERILRAHRVSRGAGRRSRLPFA